MPNSFDVLWLSASPSLQHLDKPLLRYLSRNYRVAQWEYYQDIDEGSSIEIAVDLLHECLKKCDRPVHILGHGISGAVALSYARAHTQQVRTLTLLAVNAEPANTWQTHYYVLRELLTISRERILQNTVRNLFGNQLPQSLDKLVTALDRDLSESPSPHSLLKVANLPQGGVVMPLMICGCKTDPVVDPPALRQWRNCLKPEDTLWECPDGHHFFHYFHPEQVGNQILNFWQHHQPQLLPKTTYQHL